MIPNISDTDLTTISGIAQSRYGYETGGILNNSKDSDDRLVARLDANLSDTQRASLTYIYTKDSIQFNQNTNTSASSTTANATGLGLESKRICFIQPAAHRRFPAQFRLDGRIFDRSARLLQGL